MARHRTKAEEIRSPENYFHKYIAMEIQKDQEKQKEYNAKHPSLEEKLEGGEEGPGKKMQLLIAKNLDGEDLEALVSGCTMFGWIEMIENPVLYEVISGLTQQQKELLTWRFEHGLSQDETAEIMGMAQQMVSRHEKRIFKKIERLLK